MCLYLQDLMHHSSWCLKCCNCSCCSIFPLPRYIRQPPSPATSVPCLLLPSAPLPPLRRSPVCCFRQPPSPRYVGPLFAASVSPPSPATSVPCLLLPSAPLPPLRRSPVCCFRQPPSPRYVGPLFAASVSPPPPCFFPPCFNGGFFVCAFCTHRLF